MNDSENIPDDFEGVDIGPKSAETFSEVIRCEDNLWNGPMGIFEDDRFSAGTFAVARAVCDATASGGKSIIGGGDSVKALNNAGLVIMTFMSTGGGASLEFLEGKELPASPHSTTTIISNGQRTKTDYRRELEDEQDRCRVARPGQRLGSGTQGSEGIGHRHLPAVHRTERSFQGGHRLQHPPRRTEHEPERLRRLHRRNRRRNAQGISTKYVILGHSERREYQRESDELIAAKAKAAHEAGLTPIVCVGEQLEERESGNTENVVGTQVRGTWRA